MSNTQRDKLRSLVVGAKKHFKRETVEVDGVEFELRAPSVKERGDLFKAAGITQMQEKDAIRHADIAELQATAVISLTYVPGTDDKVFDPSDKATFLSMPAGGVFDTLAEVAIRMLNVKTGEVSKN